MHKNPFIKSNKVLGVFPQFEKRSANNLQIYKGFEALKLLNEKMDANVNNNQIDEGEEEEQEQVEEYLIKKFKFASAACSLGKEINGEKCKNEDSYLVKEHIFDKKLNVYGVFDGHGDEGHIVSNYVKDYMNQY